MAKYCLHDPEHYTDELVECLSIKPFKESVLIYFVELCGNDSIAGNIKQSLNLGKYLRTNDVASVSIKAEVVIAAINIAKKFNWSLLIAHTHPPKGVFPESWQVIHHGGFSKKDLEFMSEINSLWNHYSPVYYLVVEDSTYCAVVYHESQYNHIQCDSLEKLGFAESKWRIQNESRE